jgi:hypothetical protein
MYCQIHTHLCIRHGVQTIVVVQVGAVKTYVASVGGAAKKQKIGWNSVYHQNWWKN